MKWRPNWWKVLGCGIVFLGGELMLWGLAALSFLEPKQTFGFWTILGGEHLFMLALGAAGMLTS